MLARLLKQHTGPLTRDLVQTPGSFGLGKVPERLKPVGTTTSICGYCATGCQLKLHLDASGRAINLSPQAHYPVNLGMACPKGWQALDPLDAPDRGTTPLRRTAQGDFESIDWATAVETFVHRFKSIQQRHGHHSAAFLSTGQIPFEEMAFLGCLWKFGMGFHHGDANTRQCMATAVSAYKQSFGFDAPPYTYADFEESDVIVLVGANLCIAHPILWQRIVRNPRSPKIIVIDPRATETAQAADQHLPLRPKGDLPLYYALAHCIIRDGRIDSNSLERTEGFEEFRHFVRDYSPAAVAEATGIDSDTIETLAHQVSEPGKRVSWWWTMGVNQSYEGVRTAQAIINLCLMTGNIGRPGTGPNSITGQCNAMGSRLFSNTTSLVGGHDFANPEHRLKVSRILGIPLDAIPSSPSLAYDQILDAAERGEIKGLWIVATNPFHSWIDSGRLAALREKLEFLVVQDMYSTTESAQVADLFLPAAGWGEKQGCFINSERRIGTLKAVRTPPGQALADFRIFRLLAHAWGCDSWFDSWTDPEAAFLQLRDLTLDRPCDITGIRDYQHIDQSGGIQWPYPKSMTTPPHPTHADRVGELTERRLFADWNYYTPTGKARIHFSPPAPPPEPPNADFPFLLLTGRGSSSQWHTQTRTAKSDILRKLSPQEAYLEIHPEDAAILGIAANDPVKVSSRRGEIIVAAYLAPTMQRGQVFLPMHDRRVNQLTHPSFDAHSRQPNYKACAVQISSAKTSSPSKKSRTSPAE
ncbi:assimilatory nitrate reductase catalytic subunit [Haloferula luteola]|uniref:Assimilatory nitrate reductase catalytic subunit n=1 Tax=Haloferula luteola TaxID=595692 RepID=A0A840VAC7_9BACT|nr:molybdopterin-dependent oxidoreductase [Haloferula luteola]MBB5350739.1 assimilatory nitrate reductase catalytic subunit [Haloferula luteola]